MSVIEIEPILAFEKLKEENSVLIDVRSDAEFNFVGTPDLSSINKEIVLLSWKIFPAMNLNPRFQVSLEKIMQEKFGDKKYDAQLFFLCRSGSRSFEAASYAESFGYKKCFNIIGGFEGGLDNYGHRANLEGWKKNNLPWKQL